jgi:hypothetical protein
MPEERNIMRIARGVAPVVENAKLAHMTETAPRPRAIGGKVVLMAAEPKPDTGKTQRMAPVAKLNMGPGVKARSRPEMKEPPAPRTKATQKEPEGYVRVRLRVTDGVATVMGAKAVEGPLVESKLQGELAYEVTLGKKRLAAGAVPDVGEQRSFPHPEGKGELAGHHVTSLPTYELQVRVPKARVTTKSLPRLEIALYRLKEPLPLERVGDAPIGQQFERELREVARVKGIRPEKLAAPVAAQLRKAFG